MRIFLILLIIWGNSLLLFTQEIRPEWEKYTSDEYIYNLQTGINNNLPENIFLNNLSDNSRANLAKQLQFKITEKSQLKKESNNGHTSIEYLSNSIFLTDIELQLVNTKTFYDVNTKKGYAISFINKYEAKKYCTNEITRVLNNANLRFSIIDTLIHNDSKFKAKEELDNFLNEIDKCNDLLIKLNLFGISNDKLLSLSQNIEKTKKKIKEEKVKLEHNTTICIICNADILGEKNLMFEEELKGLLTDKLIGFTNDTIDADWIINIKAKSRKFNYQNINSKSLYFAIVDSKISIYKNKTSQLVYENKLSTKGGHTLNYNEAVLIAYSKLSKQLSNIIIKFIKQ